MTRQLGPRMVHLTDQALAALPHDGTMSTPAVIAAIGLSAADAQAVWRALDWLERHGQIVRVPVDESRTVHWRRIEAAELADLEQLLDERGEIDGG